MTEKEFEKYYFLYSKEVFKVAYSYTNQKEESEDILQNVFVKLINNKNKFKDDQEIKYWLIKVTINECIDYLRYRNKRKSVKDYKHIYQAEYRNNRDEENFFLSYYVSKLPDKYKKVILLYYYNKYSTSEISSLLKIKEDNVRKLLERGRKILKERLEDD